MRLALKTFTYASMHLTVGGSYSLERVEFADRDQAFTSHIARLRAEAQISTITSMVGFIQYSSAQDAVAANIRFRFNPGEGRDLYLVWNEGLVTDRHSFVPVRPLSTERTLLVKYSHTFRLAL